MFDAHEQKIREILGGFRASEDLIEELVLTARAVRTWQADSGPAKRRAWSVMVKCLRQLPEVFEPGYRPRRYSQKFVGVATELVAAPRGARREASPF